MTMTPEEKRGYNRGYQAGRRRLAEDYSRELASWRREQFKQQAALVALPILAAPGSNWGTTKSGVHTKYSNMAEYAEAAFNFAERLAKHTYFSGSRFEEPPAE